MIKKIVLLCVCFISCFLLSFFIVYAFTAFRLASGNAAVIIAVLSSICIAAALTILRNIFMLRKEDKVQKATLQNNQLNSLLLLSDADFFKAFADYNGLEQYHISSGLLITKDKTFAFIRQHGKVDIDQGIAIVRLLKEKPGNQAYCMILGAGGEDVKKLLQNNSCTIIPDNEILDFAQAAYTGEADLSCKKSTKEKLNDILLDKKLFKSCLKYAILLALVSIFSFYRVWYLSFAGLLLLVAILSKIKRKKSHSSTIL